MTEILMRFFFFSLPLTVPLQTILIFLFCSPLVDFVFSFFFLFDSSVWLSYVIVIMRYLFFSSSDTGRPFFLCNRVICETWLNETGECEQWLNNEKLRCHNWFWICCFFFFASESQKIHRLEFVRLFCFNFFFYQFLQIK